MFAVALLLLVLDAPLTAPEAWQTVSPDDVVATLLAPPPVISWELKCLPGLSFPLPEAQPSPEQAESPARTRLVPALLASLAAVSLLRRPVHRHE